MHSLLLQQLVRTFIYAARYVIVVVFVVHIQALQSNNNAATYEAGSITVIAATFLHNNIYNVNSNNHVLHRNLLDFYTCNQYPSLHKLKQRQRQQMLLIVRSGLHDDNDTRSNQFANLPSIASSMGAILFIFGISTMIGLQQSPTDHLQSTNDSRDTNIVIKRSKNDDIAKSDISMMQMITLVNNPFQQFETVGMIPKIYFDHHLSIYGYTERVIDGDTIRVRHIPGYAMLLPNNNKDVDNSSKSSSSSNNSSKGKGRRGGPALSDTTLVIRLYGIDAPEIAKNKNQITQPFGIEARDYMTQSIYHQIIKITLLRKDQYGRAVCMVETIPSNIFDATKDLSIELARQGYAELYTGGGAEYNDKKDDLLKALQEAKKNNRGIWSLGDARISAAEEKRILKSIQ